ncbi:EpsG family protein [Rosenbergiella australiborealis]|uniref:EpsG family protein n=1 Tax=Rosenbergiella australiborealis TaxID=1544696 RepID=UPI001F4D5257|nr:EpsG family protein [Rosenbergiella australiborealis]
MLDPVGFIIFYISVFIFLSVCLFFSIKVRVNSPIFFTIVFITLMTLLAGLRSQNIGSDTYTFYNLTKSMVQSDSYLWAKDYFYYFVARLGFEISGFQGYVFLPSLVTSSSLGVAIYRIVHLSFILTPSRSKIMNETVCLLIIFILIMSSSDFLMQIVNQTRQVMAFSIFLLAYSFYIERKYIIFLSLMIIAIFSHHSLFMVLLSMLLTIFIKDSRVYMIFIFISFFLFLTGISTQLLNALGLGVSEDSIYAHALNSVTSLYIKTAITLFFGVLCFLFWNGDSKNKISTGLLNIYLTLASIAILYLNFGEGSNRIQRYEGVLFPLIFILLARKKKINALHFVVIAFLSLSYVFFMMSYSSTLLTLGFYTQGMKAL